MGMGDPRRAGSCRAMTLLRIRRKHATSLHGAPSRPAFGGQQVSRSFVAVRAMPWRGLSFGPRLLYLGEE
jgi:hypothetical protein